MTTPEAQERAREPEFSVQEAIDMAERSLVFWINQAWNGHVAGDARDFRRTAGAVFDRLRDDLALTPLPPPPEDCAQDTLLAALSRPSNEDRLREALGQAMLVIDYAAEHLWNGRPDAVQQRPAHIDTALRIARAALKSSEGEG